MAAAASNHCRSLAAVAEPTHAAGVSARANSDLFFHFAFVSVLTPEARVPLSNHRNHRGNHCTTTHDVKGREMSFEA